MIILVQELGISCYLRFFDSQGHFIKAEHIVSSKWMNNLRYYTYNNKSTQEMKEQEKSKHQLIGMQI